MDIRVTITGTQQVGDLLKKIRARIEAPEPALAVAGQMIESFTIKRFSAQQDPAGDPWKSLSQSTLAARQKGKGAKRGSVATVKGSGPLRRGERRRALQSGPVQRSGRFSDKGAKKLIDTGALRGGIRTTLGAKIVSVGVEGPAKLYAATHQFGRGAIGWRKKVKTHSFQKEKFRVGGSAAIPRRAFLPLNEAGGFERRGPAGELLKKVVVGILRYLVTGVVPGEKK